MFVLIVSALLPTAYAGLDFQITVFVSNKTSYNIGETPKLWAQVQNIGTVTIEAYDLHGVYTITSPSDGLIQAGEGWSAYSTEPGRVTLIENTDNPWTIPNGAEAGLYSISVIVTSRSTGVSHPATVSNAFSVNAPPAPDFRVFATPANQIIEQGQTASYTVTVESLNGWANPVQLSCYSTPPQSTVQFNPPSVNPTGTSIMTIGTTDATSTGTFNLLIRGTSGDRYHDFSGSSVTVNQRGTSLPDYQISITPSWASVVQGGSVSFTITAKAYNGYNYPVTLRGLPTGSGLRLTFSGSETTTITPTSQGATTTLTLSASVDATTGQWYFIVYGKDSTGLSRQTSAIVQVNSNIQGISVSSLSTDRSSYNPTDPITFFFAVTNQGGSSITLRPIVKVVDFGSWQGSDITLAPGTSKSVSVTVSKPGGWLPGTKTWGVILIGPPPSYPNLIYNMSTTSTFNILGNAYTITIYAKTTSEAVISGAEIYLGSQNMPYQRIVTKWEGLPFLVPAASATYSATAIMYVLGESMPRTSDGASASGYIFDHWEFSGGATVNPSSSASTTVTISGTGVVTAYFARIDVNLDLNTPPSGTVTKDPPANIIATASISIIPADATSKCLYANRKTVYIRASLEGWGADGNFDEWYQPASGAQAYTIGSGLVSFTWQFSSLSPAPLPGTYSINLLVFNDATPSASFPPTTGPIAGRKLKWVFAFNRDHSYVEIYGTSQARVIHIHWDSDNVGDAKTIKDMLTRMEQVNWAFTITEFVTGVAEAAGRLAEDNLGVLNDLTAAVVGQEATRQSDGSYDLVIYQTLGGENTKYKGGTYYETPLVGAEGLHARDIFFTSVGTFLGLMTVVSVVLAIPTGGVSLLMLAAGGISAAGLIITAYEHAINIPDILFEDRFANLPAYGSASIVFPESSPPLTSSNEIQNSHIGQSPASSIDYLIFSENFESYSIDSFPSAGGWELVFDGMGATYQVVSNAYWNSPSKSLQLWGRTESWSAVAQKRFFSTASSIGYEFAILIETRGSGYSDHPGFFCREAGPWGAWYAAVSFDHGDGKIKAEDGAVLGSWNTQTWYRVKVVLNRQTNTYSVSINGQLVGQDLQTSRSDTSMINGIGLTGAWPGQKVYYDDVSVFFVEGEATYAYAPDGSQYTGVTMSSITPSQVVSATGSTATVSVNYKIENPPLQGQDTGLMLVYSWGGGWPPVKYFGIIGGAAGCEGSASFTLEMPLMPGTYYAWVVIGLGATFAEISQGFGIDLFSTSVPHITFQVQASVNVKPTVSSLSTDKSSPQMVGATITWTCSASDPDDVTLYYRFWKLKQGGSWVMVQDWSTSNTYTWITSSADVGDTMFGVWVRDDHHAGPDAADAYANSGYYFQIQEAVNVKPTVTSLYADKSSPQTVGTTIVWTCVANDPDDVTLYYRFWKFKSGGSWVMIQDWSTSNTYTWVTTSSDIGGTLFGVWVRDGKHAGPDAGDAYANSGYYFQIQESVNVKPTINSLSADKASPQQVGTTIVWTCTANDPDDTTLYYRFWKLKGGGTWTMVQDWSTSNTYTWTTSSADIGGTLFGVWVRDGHHAGTNAGDAYFNSGYYFQIQEAVNVKPTINSLSADKSNPQTVGTSIVWTCSASDPDDATLYYRFWKLKQGGTWVMVQDWSTSNAYTWVTTSSDVGSTLFGAWVRDGKHAGPTVGDAYANSGYYFQIDANIKPTITSFTADRSSPQAVGTMITWACSASDPDDSTLYYRFWKLKSGGSWVMVQDWSTSNTYTWVTTLADIGGTLFGVWVRDGHHAGPDAGDVYFNSGYYFQIQGSSSYSLPAYPKTPSNTAPKDANTLEYITQRVIAASSSQLATSTVRYQIWAYSAPAEIKQAFSIVS